MKLFTSMWNDKLINSVSISYSIYLVAKCVNFLIFQLNYRTIYLAVYESNLPPYLSRSKLPRCVYGRVPEWPIVYLSFYLSIVFMYLSVYIASSGMTSVLWSGDRWAPYWETFWIFQGIDSESEGGWGLIYKKSTPPPTFPQRTYIHIDSFSCA